MPPPPPLLLTKRVTAFLRANLSPPIIHTAMLTTPSGSLLAHAGDMPASALRRQCAVAAQLWAIQSQARAARAAAEHHQQQPGESADTGAEDLTAVATPGATTTVKRRKDRPPVVTVQLDTGAVFVIRRLRCGMLFICMGGSEGSKSNPNDNTAGQRTPTPSHLPHGQQLTSPSPRTVPHSSQALADPLATTDLPPPALQLPHHPAPTSHSHKQKPSASPLLPGQKTPTPSHPHPQPPRTPPSGTGQPTSGPGSPHPSESAISIASVASNETTATCSTITGSNSTVSLMRRQVEELARWLDEKLAGLCVPEEGIGVAGTGVSGMGMGMGQVGYHMGAGGMGMSYSGQGQGQVYGST
ncbi:uncharacterized protein CTHT_0042340 [Thermochaetoides thermophila DSM 1495]|uniref:Uncharacterized protein n=1 Tax=Chaetomium thermophilum (strain DSM 1495 / CBS 144.50 / IMI 039719) TaxID=759272 RepID=G0SAH8_CHATD|nr:hypothetical protein CTHT_0042340 [Thermochaetoides thermophila DSM 1495]EGS19750.1 hypothetical protein CTHT_0042340 [Thermochaetoides thermophila DSM 1495]